jgi:hypothetical protein
VGKHTNIAWEGGHQLFETGQHQGMTGLDEASLSEAGEFEQPTGPSAVLFNGRSST